MLGSTISVIKKKIIINKVRERERERERERGRHMNGIIVNNHPKASSIKLNSFSRNGTTLRWKICQN